MTFSLFLVFITKFSLQEVLLLATILLNLVSVSEGEELKLLFLLLVEFILSAALFVFPLPSVLTHEVMLSALVHFFFLDLLLLH